MKRVVLIATFIVGSSYGMGFANIQEYPGVISGLYKKASSFDFDQLNKCICDVKDNKRLKMNAGSFNSVAARVWYKIYRNDDLRSKFGEAAVTEKMLTYTSEAAKSKSVFVFPILNNITIGPLLVCSRAMELMLTNELNDSVLLKQAANSVFGTSAGPKLYEIFGEDVMSKIPDYGIEDDHGKYRPLLFLLCFQKQILRDWKRF